MNHYLFTITILFFVFISISLVYGAEDKNINNNSSIQQNLNTTSINDTSSFNIAVAADWGCEENTKKTAFKKRILNLLLQQEI